MNLHYFIMERYGDWYPKLRGFAFFLTILLPSVFLPSLVRAHSPVAYHALLFLTGWFIWTFVEYILHRFYMHDRNSHSALMKTHQHHHNHPTELLVTAVHRMAMLPILGVLISIAIFLNNYFTLIVGFCFGIEGYFLIHRILHLKQSEKLFRKLVRYHIYHHCKYPNTCFGISVTWWDDIFNTVPQNPKITQRIIDFYFKAS